MGYDFQAWEDLNKSLNSRINRRRLLQLTGCGIAGTAGAAILAACGGPNPPHPITGTIAPGGTVTTNSGPTRQIASYYLGYNNVPIHSPPWDDPNTVKAATQMKPGTLRYPGGTVANYWDWRSGWFVPKAPSGFLSAPRSTYRLQELQTAVQATGAKPIYVLNMLTSDLNSQLEMLRTAKSMGLPVQFVEMGNEFYLSTGVDSDNAVKFPTGREYGTMATNWIRAIRAEFPDVKIAAVGGVPGSSGDQRKANWNRDLFQTLQGADALTLHPYVGIKNGTVTPGASSESVARLTDLVSTRWQQFENEIQSLPPNMKVWITEYNFVDPSNNVFHTWIHGVFAAKMSLTFLEEVRTELVCFYDMIGKIGYETIFYNRQTQGGDNSPPPYGLTAAGWAMRLLGDTMQGMTSAQKLSFSSTTATNDSLQGWIFTDGTHQQTFLINSSAESFTWTPDPALAQGTHFQQLMSDPFKIITGPGSLTVKNGTPGGQLTLPAYSVTQLK